MRTIFAAVIHVAFLCLVLPPNSVILGADPQSSDNTAQAKQHYQNAVAAISKNDWQTAKSELLQAEKLAPSNALVHYDLALAYSQTGQPKSAQAELTKALQLGLPAEQRQAAEKLKQQLSAAAGTAGVQKSATPDGSDASLKTTTDFLKSKIEGASTTGRTEVRVSCGTEDLDMTFTNEMFEVDGCSIHHKLRITVLPGGPVTGFCDPAKEHQQLREITIPLQYISLSSSKAEELPNPFEGGGTWKKAIYRVKLEFNEPVPFTSDGKPDTPTKVWSFRVEDRDIADRLLRAFTHAAKLCGAKEEAF
jgi:hypothetical protein